MVEKRPRIIAFICNWGAYSAAEMAGVNRRPYSANVRLVRLMCLGQLSTAQIIGAFDRGADGVILLGCPPSDCHYGFGNHQAEKAYEEARDLLDTLGVETGRLRLEWILPGDAAAFARTLTAFAAEVSGLARSPVAAAAKSDQP